MSDTESRARRACMTCRMQKRKCDKQLPACSLCQKSARSCSYDGGSLPPLSNFPPASPRSSQQRSQVAFGLSPSTSDTQNDHSIPRSEQINHDFPASFFLDYSAFKMLGTANPSTSAFELAPELKSCIGNLAQIRHTADLYFNSTHGHFPIGMLGLSLFACLLFDLWFSSISAYVSYQVSKLRFYQKLAASPIGVPIDTTLLVAAMQLHTNPPDSHQKGRGGLYDILGAGLSTATGADMYTIQHLQAYLLVALHEVANAIYPAAYLTIGHCVRLGHLLGISPNENAPQLLKSPVTATELEERRRTWWSIVVLDRYVNLGGPRRPLGCDDPGPNDFLPTDDGFWDRGELSAVQPLITTANIVDPVCSFARTCQASHLLSRVLQQITRATQGRDAACGEAIQLHRTLLALATVIDSELRSAVEKTSNPIAQTPLLTAAGLCFSALLTLYDHYSCAEESSAEQRSSAQWDEMQRIAISGLREVSGRVIELALVIKMIAELGGTLYASPLMSDSLYQAGANYVWYLKETGNEEYRNMKSTVISALELLGTRWRAPREYIHMLHCADLHTHDL